jgi:endoglucanase
MKRRSFIRTTGLITLGLSLAEKAALAASRRPCANKLPKWKGFNLLDFFSPDPRPVARPSVEDHFKWMEDWGFNFIRLPIAYPHYLKFDRGRNILPEEVYHTDEEKLEEIDRLVAMAHKHNMHVSLNLHRAPGYCVNAGFHEPYNLWTDQAAQDAFYFHWDLWARRFKNVSPEKISFDLLNEPCMRDDMNDQHSRSLPVPGELYRKVAMNAALVIRKENSRHLVIADGNNVGNSIIPEILDLDIAQSCRGYYPHAISHYKAPWANKDPDHLPEPLWPGLVGNQYLGREMLEVYYKPWIGLVQKGVGVHCGECGCWNKTPYDVFIAWFSDVVDILSVYDIGFAPWNFIGDFGVLDSGRTDLAYEDWYGHKLDRKFLNLLREH